MILIISPAKNMNIRQRDGLLLSKPVFLAQTKTIAEKLKIYQPWELETLMKVNEKLAVQAFLDIQSWQEDKAGSAALLSYDGLVFKNIKADEWSKEELIYSNEHLRILSGFYGVLKPLDEIQPYRLEMQCKIKVEGGNLYQYWGESLYEEVTQKEQVILNLASEEYAKSIRKYAEPEQFIDVEFLTFHKGKLKTLATWAKMARGQMVSYIVKNKIDKIEDIKAFEWDGYEYEESLSTERKYVFVKR